MRSPFDSSDSAWWAVHGASSNLPPKTEVALELAASLLPGFGDDPDELGAGSDIAPEPSTPMAFGREGLSVHEFLEATERETVRDVSLVRTAAALASEVQLQPS
jgi:hypothetical protein